MRSEDAKRGGRNGRIRNDERDDGAIARDDVASTGSDAGPGFGFIKLEEALVDKGCLDGCGGVERAWRLRNKTPEFLGKSLGGCSVRAVHVKVPSLESSVTSLRDYDYLGAR